MINVREFTNNEISTESVQKAIDYAAKNKKVLFFPGGVYNVTSLRLSDNSSIYLDKDAVLSASLDAEEWEKTPLKPIIYCENAKNICVRGKGTITANGYAFVDENGYRLKTEKRPEAIIRFVNVSEIVVENVTLRESVGWTFHLDNCEDVFIDGVIIRNPTYNTRKNSDGIDINGCRNVTIMNCDIETGDDAICLKNVAYKPGVERYVNEHATADIKRPDMYNINVYNCTVASSCNSTKIGTETVGSVIKDVSFEKITVKKHPAMMGHGAGNPPYDSYHSLTAISVQSNDGAVVKNINFKDYNVETVEAPVFILYQQRGRIVPSSDAGEISGINIENIYVKKAYRTSQILSSHYGKIKNVKISGMYVKSYEAPCEHYEPLLPDGEQYPDPYNYGRFPAYGLYAANAEIVKVEKDVIFVDKSNSGRKAVEITKNNFISE